MTKKKVSVEKSSESTNPVRYYWCKSFQRDFTERDGIVKRLRIVARDSDSNIDFKRILNDYAIYNGIFFLALNTKGVLGDRLANGDFIPFSIDEYKTYFIDFGFDEETINTALEDFRLLGLISINEYGEDYLTEYSSRVGSETPYAMKMRKYRESNKIK